jgi:Ca2+/Na+ antiporter
MTFLETLYGSQYYEIHQKGRDGNKGRLNGNLFLSALIILFLFAVVMICISFIPGFNESSTRMMRSIFGYSNGKSVGRLLAIPLMAIIYFVITLTVGSEKSFNQKVEVFMQSAEEEKKKANKVLMIPFFILGVIVFGLAFYNM